ncbi:protein JINGUBANG-like [Typha angustifolia]|uniref:protein JINGUBANG-like n=1 Tax=Typha angustifolia TaxID=59011 RepID=UPI003C2F79F5
MDDITPSALSYDHTTKKPDTTRLSKSLSLSSQPSLPLPSLDYQIPSSPPSSIHQCVTTLKGHSSYISSLAIHGNSLYTGSSDKQIRLWQLPIPLEPAPLQDGPSSSTVAVTKSPIKSLLVSNGNYLFSSHQDHKIRVWRIGGKRKGKLLAVLPTVTDRILSLASPEKYVEVRRHKRCTWVHHVDAVSALALSHDAVFLYSVSWDRTLKVWRTSDFRCMESVGAAHDDAINAVAVSRDGYVYTGSADTKIKVWKQPHGERKHSLVSTLEQHRSAVNALALSPDSFVLYSGACDRSVIVWEGRGCGGQMAATGVLRGHKKAILCLATAGELVCSGSADRTVRLWRRGEDKGYSCLAVLEGHGGAIKSLAVAGAAADFYTDGSSGHETNSAYFVCSGGMDCDVKVWKLLVPSFQVS